MSQYDASESSYPPLSCTDYLRQMVASSSTASTLTSSTSSTTSSMSTSSTSISSEVSSTIHITILPSTTSSTSIGSTTPFSGSQQAGNGITLVSATVSSAGVAEPSSMLAIESSSQTKREHVIIVVLMSVIVFTLFFFFIFYLFRRSRQQYLTRKSEAEEGRMEIADARAMWSVDESLKEGYSVKSFQLLTPSTLRIPPPAAVPAVSHSLYHPGLKRSRTLSNVLAPQYPLPRSTTSRPAMSYPHVVNGQTSNLEPPLSPLSFRAYLKSESKPLTPFTTMQTRRPQTPDPIEPPRPLRQSEPVKSNRFLGRKIVTRSVWSSSPVSSTAPSSPSIYSPQSPKHIPSQNSLHPPPTPRHSPPTLYSPYRSPVRETFPMDENSVIPKLALQTNHPRDDSPTLHPDALPRFRLMSGDCPSTAVDAKIPPIPQVPPPDSPHRPPRSPTPPLPRSPESPKSPWLTRSPGLPKSPRPVRPVIDIPVNPFETQLEVSPSEQIERWLDGSTGTVSAFGSLLAEGDLAVSSSNGSSPLARTLDEENSRKEQVAESLPPQRILPIRAMRSSSSRKGSRDDIRSAF